MRKDETADAWVDSVGTVLSHLKLGNGHLAKTACYDAGPEMELEIEAIHGTIASVIRRLSHVLKYHHEGGRDEFVPVD